MIASEDAEVAVAPSTDASAANAVAGGPPAPKARRTRGGQIASLEQELKSALGTKVEVRQMANGRGKIVVHFANATEFDRLREVLCSKG